MSDYTTLTLGVQSWSQAVSHGEQWPPRQLRCIARTSGEEELRLTGGPNIRTLDFHLLISRGEAGVAEMGVFHSDWTFQP